MSRATWFAVTMSAVVGWGLPLDLLSAAEIDTAAEKALRAMTDYADGLKSFRVELSANFKIQAGGSSDKLAFSYSITSEKPNRLATLARGSEGVPVVICDGKQLFVYLPGAEKYVLIDAPSSLAEIVASEPVQGISLANPVLAGALLPFNSYDDLAKTLEAASYVGEEKIAGAKCHHVKLVQKEIEWDLWIDAGKKPIVKKIQPTLDKWLKSNSGQLPADAKVDAIVTFKTWIADPPVKDKDFKIAPSPSASEVASFAPGKEGDAITLLTGKAAPSFELGLVGGGIASPAAHKGKEVVILDFWATWCPPCVGSLPALSEVAASYRSKGVAFYAVNLKEDADTITEFLKSKQLNFPVAMDAEGAVANLYHVSGIPQTVIIGKDGTVQKVHIGAPADVKKVMSAELDVILAGKGTSK